MYDINTKNVKRGKRIYYIFFAFGLLALIIIVGVATYNSYLYKQLDSKTNSIGVTIREYRDDYGVTYSPSFSYEVDEKTYYCSFNSTSVKPGGTSVVIYYSSNNPSKCMVGKSKISSSVIFFVMLLATLFMCIGILNIRKINKRLEMIKELNRKGKLIKNIPYHMEDSGIAINNKEIKKIVIDYVLPSGQTICLNSEPRYDEAPSNKDTVDLIIDENYVDNYFIDYEINRVGGNLITDYYIDKNNRSV